MLRNFYAVVRDDGLRVSFAVGIEDALRKLEFAYLLEMRASKNNHPDHDFFIKNFEKQKDTGESNESNESDERKKIRLV